MASFARSPGPCFRPAARKILGGVAITSRDCERAVGHCYRTTARSRARLVKPSRGRWYYGPRPCGSGWSWWRSGFLLRTGHLQFRPPKMHQRNRTPRISVRPDCADSTAVIDRSEGPGLRCGRASCEAVYRTEATRHPATSASPVPEWSPLRHSWCFPDRHDARRFSRSR